jgi:hypothetical protein
VVALCVEQTQRHRPWVASDHQWREMDRVELAAVVGVALLLGVGSVAVACWSVAGTLGAGMVAPIYTGRGGGGVRVQVVEACGAGDDEDDDWDRATGRCRASGGCRLGLPTKPPRPCAALFRTSARPYPPAPGSQVRPSAARARAACGFWRGGRGGSGQPEAGAMRFHSLVWSPQISVLHDRDARRWLVGRFNRGNSKHGTSGTTVAVTM